MPRSAVIGGSGFLGRHLIDALLAKSDMDTQISVFDLRPYVHHNPDSSDRITVHTGTVTQLGHLLSACREVDVVYHCVSADPMDNRNEHLMWSVNVEGTKNVIEACKQCAVPKLVFVSSASVVFDGHHILNADESIPYPSRYIDFYSKTKAEAEKLVLAANHSSLLTCSIRPSAIFGERDPTFVPRLLDAAQQGKTKYIIGDGKTIWEFTYVGNVADACIKAADKLNVDSPVAGSAYFITNDESTLFWSHIGLILEGLGYEKPSICIPFFVCYILAIIIELIFLLISPLHKPKKPPTFSRARVMLLTTHRQLSCAKAKRDFGYRPAVSLKEATDKTIQYFKKHLASSNIDKQE